MVCLGGRRLAGNHDVVLRSREARELDVGRRNALAAGSVQGSEEAVTPLIAGNESVIERQGRLRVTAREMNGAEIGWERVSQVIDRADPRTLHRAGRGRRKAAYHQLRRPSIGLQCG